VNSWVVAEKFSLAAASGEVKTPQPARPR
jgi:hypothetical protein